MPIRRREDVAEVGCADMSSPESGVDGLVYVLYRPTPAEVSAVERQGEN